MNAMPTDPSGLAPYPPTPDEARHQLRVLADMLFDPVLTRTLGEWAQLRRRCRRKALKRQAVGRMLVKLSAANGWDDLHNVVADADPEEAYALLATCGDVAEITYPNMVLLDGYRSKADFEERWGIVAARKVLTWAQDQVWLYDGDDFLGHRE